MECEVLSINARKVGSGIRRLKRGGTREIAQIVGM